MFKIQLNLNKLLPTIIETWNKILLIKSTKISNLLLLKIVKRIKWETDNKKINNGKILKLLNKQRINAPIKLVINKILVIKKDK